MNISVITSGCSAFDIPIDEYADNYNWKEPIQILCGAPGKGKSILARKMAESRGTSATVSADQLKYAFELDAALQHSPDTLIIEEGCPSPAELKALHQMVSSGKCEISAKGLPLAMVDAPSLVLICTRERCAAVDDLEDGAARTFYLL